MWWIGALWFVGCQARVDQAGQRGVAAAVESDSSAATANGEWAQRVGQPVVSKAVPAPRDVKIEPANLVDTEYASAELVPVRRFVYRVMVAVPSHLQPQKPPITPAAGELHIDVSEHRLRARFVGPGWPIDEGSEVRLRGDVPGVYLFDSNGGRPLQPGQLSGWFQGYALGMRSPRTELIIQDFAASPNDGIGDLLCVFLAEWTHTPRDEVLHRCAGMIPPAFRFGVFSADLTAAVPMSLPRAELRADAVNPPVALRGKGWLLEADEMARIPSGSGRLADARVGKRGGAEGGLASPPATTSTATTTGADGAGAAGGGGMLTVENRMPTRLVMIVQGVAIGWVDAASTQRFDGLRPGSYRVAAVRTSNQQLLAAEVMTLPGQMSIGRPLEVAPDADQLSEPLLASPEAAR